MNYDFAPMEGLTDSIYRRLHHAYFGGISRYYMPFLSPTMHQTLTRKEDRELPPADRVGFTAVPQILTKVAEDFLWASQVCLERGYSEINLNIGCPSGTVVAKGKGAGMLADADGLDRFLEAIFAASPLPISVKTRVGILNHDEFPRLMEVFNRYPIKELIVHPRVRKDFYNTPLREDAFALAYEISKNPLCYNGDICTLSDAEAICARYPNIVSVMIGRGLIGDPAMLSPDGVTAAKLEAFHNDLLDAYMTAFGSARNAMFRMKENWRYQICRFDGGEKLFKRLRKTTDIAEYRLITAELFHTIPLASALNADWIEY